MLNGKRINKIMVTATGNATSIKRLKIKRNRHPSFDIGFLKTNKIKSWSGATHYSMFNVGRSMFDVHLSKQPCAA
jgi:hypothetical protein